MKNLVAAALSISMFSIIPAEANETTADFEKLGSVAPALKSYATNDLNGGLWQRPDLSVRDRSIVTVSALIARGQATAMPNEFARALDNGVTPAELSEIITHLAFYAGWDNAISAVAVTETLFSDRGIEPDQLPSVELELLPLDEEAEARREGFVQERYGEVSKGVVDYTREILFLDLWLRPALAPRDRSLVTVSALIAAGQVEQMPFHLNRAMDNGLTQPEAAEVLTQLAFYAGWPKAFSALPVASEVFESRVEK